MTLGEYAAHINKLAKQWPGLEVVHASDDEGNSFHKVIYTPVVGSFEDSEFESGGLPTNAICIN